MLNAVLSSVLCFISLVVSEKMTWEDNLDMVKESDTNQLVLLHGQNIDIVCQVNQASDGGHIKWSMDGKPFKNPDKPILTKEKGDWLMKSHLKLVNVTEEMDGVTVECIYSQFIVIDKFGSWNSWTLQTVVNVFTVTEERENKN